MESAVVDPELAAAFEQIAAGVEAVRAAGLVPANASDAAVQVRELGRLDAMVSSLLVDQVAAVDAAGVAGAHRFGHYMVRNIAKTSPVEAVRRNQCRKAFDAMPALAEAHAVGELSRCQARALAAVYANPRTKDAVVAEQRRLVGAAKRRTVKEYEGYLQRFVDRVDQDGAFSDVERQHGNRKARLCQDFDKSWRLDGGFGSFQGATMSQILEHFYAAETLADWDKARAEHGDNATREHLPRTSRQRYADALEQIFLDAVSKHPDAKPPRFVINIVMDHQTAQNELVYVETGHRPADDPLRKSYSCRTLDGVDLNPTEAIAYLVAGQLDFAVRRAVIDAKSVVIDLGQQRTFTGSARLAAQLPHTHCLWPGCHTKVSHCQIDHRNPWSTGGQTNQANADPLCGFHNRHKHHLNQRGYQVTRNPLGDLELHNPDRTTIQLE